MNVVIVSPAFPFRGGIAHHSAALADHIMQRHNVSIVTFSRQYPALLFPGKTQLDIGGTPPLAPVYQWIDSVNPFTWISTARKIKALNPDVVIFAYSLPFFGPCYGTIARLVRSSGKTKIVFLCHNIIPHESTIIDTVLTKFAFASSDLFMVQSSIVEKELLQLFPRAMYALSPHPVYEMFGAPLPKLEAKKRIGVSAPHILLFFGYVREYKGLMILIDAFDRLQRLGFEPGYFHLLIVGEFYDDEKKYRAKIKEFNLEPYISIVSEYVPKENVAAYVCSSDVVILPYRSASQSGVAQVAYNFDKPVIVTNVGGLAEVVVDGKTGFIVPPEDPDALAESIVRFYRENKEHEFCLNVKEEKKKYSWEYFVQSLEKLIDRI